MRKYEVMILIDPTVEERQVDSVMEKYLKVVTDEKGTVDKVDVWTCWSMKFDRKLSHQSGRHGTNGVT